MAGRRRTQKTEYYFDYSLLFIILFLTGFGLVMIYSASAYDATTQNLNEDYYLMHQAFAAALDRAALTDEEKAEISRKLKANGFNITF